MNDKITSARAVLDELKANKQRLDAKFAEVNREVERFKRGETLRAIRRPNNLPPETNFMRDVAARQVARRNLLASKCAETERLRQEVKLAKDATERTIDALANEIRRARRETLHHRD